MQDAKMDEAIKHAMADKDKTVRTAGIELIDKLNIPKQLMASLLSDVINTKTTEEKQASLITLGKLPVENTKKFSRICCRKWPRENCHRISTWNWVKPLTARAHQN